MQLLLELRWCLLKTRQDCLLARGAVGGVPRVEARLFDKPPASFDEIQVRCICWQEEQLTPSFVRDSLYQNTPLLARLV